MFPSVYNQVLLHSACICSLAEACILTLNSFQAYLFTAMVISLYESAATSNMLVCVFRIGTGMCIQYVCGSSVRSSFYNSSSYNKFMPFTAKEIEIKNMETDRRNGGELKQIGGIWYKVRIFKVYNQ